MTMTNRVRCAIAASLLALPLASGCSNSGTESDRGRANSSATGNGATGTGTPAGAGVPDTDHTSGGAAEAKPGRDLPGSSSTGTVPPGPGATSASTGNPEGSSPAPR